MRRGSYPASEDALLGQIFGREAVAGRTVLCSAGASAGEDEWNVVVVQDLRGAVFLLECTRDPAGATIVAVTEASQTAFARVFESAVKGAMEGRELDLAGWVVAERAVGQSDPDFDFEFSMATWDRVIGLFGSERTPRRRADDDPELLAMAELVEMRTAGMRPN